MSAAPGVEYGGDAEPRAQVARIGRDRQHRLGRGVKRVCAVRGSGAARARGRLKIDDDWNAITTIALSQSNPMKAMPVVSVC